MREGVVRKGGYWVVVKIKSFKTVNVGIGKLKSCDRGDGVFVNIKFCQRGGEYDVIDRRQFVYIQF